MRHGLSLVLLGIALIGAPACSAAEHDAEDRLDEAALTASDLRSLSRIQGVLEGEGVRELTYDPAAHGYRASLVPFEGIDVALEPGEAVEVEVRGAFPSNARVLVVDADYRVVARGRTEAVASGGLRPLTEAQSGAVGRAVVRARVPESGMRILVRDARWDRPMTFDVGVRR